MNIQNMKEDFHIQLELNREVKIGQFLIVEYEDGDSDMNGTFYILDEDNGIQNYLHEDAVIKHSASCGVDGTTAWYDTREDAFNTLTKYFENN